MLEEHVARIFLFIFSHLVFIIRNFQKMVDLRELDRKRVLIQKDFRQKKTIYLIYEQQFYRRLGKKKEYPIECGEILD